jgi:hypothetical protein
MIYRGLSCCWLEEGSFRVDRARGYHKLAAKMVNHNKPME